MTLPSPKKTKLAPAGVVEIFDPPMCCPTGLCGPVLDQTLLDVNEMIFALQNKGIEVKRYQMSSDPNAFLNNAEVMRLIRERQMEALPITLINGMLSKTSAYPTIEEIDTTLKVK